LDYFCKDEVFAELLSGAGLPALGWAAEGGQPVSKCFIILARQNDS